MVSQVPKCKAPGAPGRFAACFVSGILAGGFVRGLNRRLLPYGSGAEAPILFRDVFGMAKAKP